MIVIGIDKESPYQVKSGQRGLVMTVPEFSTRAAREMEQSAAFQCLSDDNKRWARVRMQGRIARRMVVAEN